MGKKVKLKDAKLRLRLDIENNLSRKYIADTIKELSHIMYPNLSGSFEQMERFHQKRKNYRLQLLSYANKLLKKRGKRSILQDEVLTYRDWIEERQSEDK